MADAMQDAIDQAVQKQVTNLQHEVDDAFSLITEDFELMITDKQDASEAVIRSGINKFLADERAEIEDIKQSVEKLKARYPGETWEE